MGINVNRIVANGLVAFFTALVAANIAGLGMAGFEVAAVAAVINGGLAGALIYKSEAEEDDCGPITRATANILLL